MYQLKEFIMNSPSQKIILKVFLILLLSTVQINSVYSQTLTGKVTDLKTKEPLAYVHIGVLNKNMGTISKEDGAFSINLSSASSADQLVFSMIGYETVKIEIGKINEYVLSIKMIPKVYELKEVIVRAKRIKEPLKLGRYETTRTTTGQSGYVDYGYGREWGLQIFNEGKKYRVLDVRFHMRFNTVDSALFRVHVYSVKDGLPDESLLRKETLVKSYKNDHWIICYIEDQDLVVAQNVIVTYEVVRFWSKRGEQNQFFFTHGSGYDRGQAFSRESSGDAWKIDQAPMVVLCLGAEKVNEVEGKGK